MRLLAERAPVVSQVHDFRERLPGAEAMLLAIFGLDLELAWHDVRIAVGGTSKAGTTMHGRS